MKTSENFSGIHLTDENEEISHVFDNFYIKDDIFILDEYNKTIRSIQWGKYPGHDDIMPEVLKYEISPKLITTVELVLLL